MATRQLIDVERRERVMLVLQRYGSNAIDDALLAALDGTIGSLDQDGGPPVVLASAHPTIFSPGLDLKKLDGRPRDAVRAVMRSFNALLRRIAVYPGPVVAAIGGHAIAGGCLLALACDRRVMARAHARLGLSEINLGIPVPAGAAAMLLALYPTRSVEQLVLEGDGFGGERAFELALVERLADTEAVLDDAVRLADRLASRPQAAYATAKRYLRSDLAAAMERRDEAELESFLDHWYNPATQDRIGAMVASMSRR